MNYFEKLNPVIKEYFNILSAEVPDFIKEYVNAPELINQNGISVSCGTFYSKLYNYSLWYSSLDHSIAVALIIWNFTHDKKQTLAGLFHDIATPVFKHCIDFMNGDYETQESTEDLTKNIIQNSKYIMNLLKRDNIMIEEVCDYHIYPIADNDTPKLSADRLEYTLSNGLGVRDDLWDLNEIEEIYKDITIYKNEEGIDELGFKTLKIAEKFVETMSILSRMYMCNKTRYSMEFLAKTMKELSNEKYITIEELYHTSEKDIINKILKSSNEKIVNEFMNWQNAYRVYTSLEENTDKYCVKVPAKKRYINPLVKENNSIKRIIDISIIAKNDINKCLAVTFDEYIWIK